MDMSEPQVRRIGALGASIAAHVAIASGLLVMLGSRPPERPDDPVTHNARVFLPNPGPMGGGGGGAAPAAPRPIEVPRHAAPAPTPVEPTPATPPPPAPLPSLDIPTDTNASRLSWNGISGDALGRGGVPGTGAGPGAGPGLGPGGPGGEGGGPRQPGGDVSSPVPIFEPRPAYTGEAMRARVEGPVELDVIVLADGTVGDVKILKNLQPALGLDVEAIKAAKLWRFLPGRHQGKPVDVRVRLVLEFKLY
jgi:protein TonB